MEEKARRGFYDLEVYRNTYEASIDVIQKILPELPKEERFYFEIMLEFQQEESLWINL